MQPFFQIFVDFTWNDPIITYTHGQIGEETSVFDYVLSINPSSLYCEKFIISYKAYQLFQAYMPVHRQWKGDINA